MDSVELPEAKTYFRIVPPSPPINKQGPDAEDAEEHASQGGVSPFTNLSDLSSDSLNLGEMNHVVRCQWMDHDDDVRSDLQRTKKEIDDLRIDFQVRVFE